MKRIFSLLLAMVLCCSMGAVTAFATEASTEQSSTTSEPVISSDPVYFFSDVPDDFWAYEAIQYMRSRNLMYGTETKVFGTSVPITRGEVVMILWRAAGRPSVPTPAKSSLFEDVGLNDYYSSAVYWARANNIANGYSAAQFGLNDSITREQLAAIIWRYASSAGVDVSVSGDNVAKFSDAGKVHSWGRDALNWATGSGLINGIGNNLLYPEGTATRAQIAQIMMRFLSSGLHP